MFGLRIGDNPQCMITTTQKPIELLIKLVKDAVLCTDLRTSPEGSELLRRAISVVISVGSSYENRANLAESWFTDIVSQYEGTRLGDQELKGLLLTDVPGALWTTALLDKNRLGLSAPLPDFERVVVAVDPPASSSSTSSEAGIIGAARGVNKHGYVLADRSGRMKPHEWAKAAVTLFRELHADKIIAEMNNGGEMVEATIKAYDPNVPVKLVWASRGKVTRAEPIATLDEKGKIHHVGTFGALEAQMTTWTPDSGLASPDRYDARVWALTELMTGIRDLDQKGWKGVRR
jgi:phage terminase large subunit-like protein